MHKAAPVYPLHQFPDLRQSAQDSVNQAGQQITQKNLNVQPTLTVRPGWPHNVIVSKDLVLQPYKGQS